MAKKVKQKKEKYVDDGHTIYSMENVPNRFGHTPKKKADKIDTTRKERWAMIRGAFKAYFPVLATVLLCFTLVMLLMIVWLKK